MRADVSQKLKRPKSPEDVSKKDIKRLLEKYPIKMPPFRHQAFEFLRYRNHPTRAMLWGMRSGKTKSAIDLACYNYENGWIDAVLIVAPNGVHSNWIRKQLPLHHWDTVPFNAHTWRLGDFTRRVKAEKQWFEDYDQDFESPELLWLAVNSESIINPKTRKLLAKFMSKRRVLLLVDESDDFSVPGAKRTQMLRAVKRKAVMRRIMTGTVVTNGPLGAYSQFELLEDQALGFGDYTEFKDHYAIYTLERGKKGRQYPVLDKYVRLKDLRDRMAEWSTVVLRDDCPDLPGLMRTEREVAPSKQQVKLYRQIHKDFELYLDENRGSISIGETSQRFNKLQQVLSGFIIDEFGDVHDIPGPNPRLDALVAELDGPDTIIWCMYKEDIRRVEKRLRKEGYKPLLYYGAVSSKEREKSIDKFMSGKGYGPFIGQPGAGGRGLDLSIAKTIIHYSHTFNARHRAQSEERGTKAGGHNVAVVDFIVPGSIDEYIRESVEMGFDIADKVSGRGLKEALERIRL